MTSPSSSTTPRFSPPARWLLCAALAALLLLAGCAETGQMNDMPRYDPLQASDFFADGRSARPQVPGALPYSPDKSPDSPDMTGLDDAGQPVKGWPVTVDKNLVQLGQDRFNIYCIVCHGPNGEGNGKVTQFNFPKPPTLIGADAAPLSNGEIFGIIQNGTGKMFPYGYRVKPAERWAVIAYIRALQAKNGAVKPQDLTPEEINKIGAAQ